MGPRKIIKKSTTYNTSVVLEVKEDSVWSSPWLALTDNNSGHDLLSQLRLSLLNGGHNHVTNTSSGETVEAGTSTGDGNDVQVASSGVVAAIHHGAAIAKSVDFDPPIKHIFPSTPLSDTKEKSVSMKRV